MIDQYARTELLIGEDGLKRLKDSSVMVFGVATALKPWQEAGWAG